jgi:hypothetical protein|tara:strand:+ start:77 stop:409 length:333 start_codon:yes stop_codon:yes gene_type:complete
MTVTKFNVPPTDIDDEKQHTRLVARAVQGSLLGRTNNVLDVTVTSNAAATTVTDSRIGVNTVAICIPTSVHSEAAAITPYRNITAPINGSMSLIHTNDANTKIYKVILVG